MGVTGLVLALILALIVIALFATLVGRYRRCPSNRILVIYGKTGRGAAKSIHGGAAFVWPLLQDYDYLDLEPFVVPIDLTNALSQENIRVSVPTTVTAAISNEPGLMQNAAVRLLGLTQDEIKNQAQDIILGQMRAVIATMKIEEINRDRQAFMAKVNDAVSIELEKIGLTVINVNIRDIEDESGYIEALGRKAAAEAINQANIDVAEQEKTGKTGVAERERDRRRAVAAADAAAVIGEKVAERDRRSRTAEFDAEAVQVETTNRAKKAAYIAEQRVAEQEARRRAEEASRVADGSIRVAEQNAQRDAELARAAREEARLRAEVVVPAEAAPQQHPRERRRRARASDSCGHRAPPRPSSCACWPRPRAPRPCWPPRRVAMRSWSRASGGPSQAASFLVVEKLVDVANVQAEAIKNLPIEKVVVWDNGGNENGGGLSGIGRRLIGVLPPMHDVARLAGLELPDYLGNLREEAKTEAKPTPTEADDAEA